MAFDLSKWLNEEVEHTQHLETRKVPRHQYLCFLVYANGGFDVNTWGCLMSHGVGHQRGLDQNDALALMQFSSFFSGLEAGGVNWSDVFKPYFDAYKAQYE